MSSALYTAAAGAAAQQVRIEILTNNLANINSSGYKAEASAFRIPENEPQAEALVQQLRYKPAILPHEIITDFSPGVLKPTENPLDMALKGDGFFCIGTRDGIRYTRNGRFALNGLGELTTAEGHFVLGQRGVIRLEGDNVRIKPDGTISTNETVVDSLRIVSFETPYPLSKEGDALYALTDPDALQIDAFDTEVIQGSIETANVDAVLEMTRLIEAGRMFEAYGNVIKTLDGSTGQLINRIGNVTA